MIFPHNTTVEIGIPLKVKWFPYWSFSAFLIMAEFAGNKENV